VFSLQTDVKVPTLPATVVGRAVVDDVRRPAVRERGSCWRCCCLPAGALHALCGGGDVREEAATLANMLRMFFWFFGFLVFFNPQRKHTAGPRELSGGSKTRHERCSHVTPSSAPKRRSDVGCVWSWKRRALVALVESNETVLQKLRWIFLPPITSQRIGWDLVFSATLCHVSACRLWAACPTTGFGFEGEYSRRKEKQEAYSQKAREDDGAAQRKGASSSEAAAAAAKDVRSPGRWRRVRRAQHPGRATRGRTVVRSFRRRRVWNG
jgi:hypothetical protein